MSIEAAAKELTQEIQRLNKEAERLNKEAERLTKLRDSLSAGQTVPAVKTGRGPYKKRAAKKTAAKTAAKTTPAAPAKKKRSMSAESRKAISDANKLRWAKKKAGESTSKAK